MSVPAGVYMCAKTWWLLDLSLLHLLGAHHLAMSNFVVLHPNLHWN